MKVKFIFCTLLISFCSIFIYAQETATVQAIAIENPRFIGFTQEEESLYSSSIIPNLAEEIITSSKLTLTGDAAKTFKYMKETENDNIGAFVAETHFLQTGLAKSSDGIVDVSLTVTEIKTNITIASKSETITETLTKSILENKIRNLVQEIFLQMGVKKEIDSESKVEVDIALLSSSIEEGASQISALDAQIKELSVSGADEKAQKKKIALEAEKSKLLIKQQVNQQKLKQAKLDNERMIQESELKKNRSEELNSTIERQRKEFEKKAATLRTKQLENLLPGDKIKIIEEKKQTVLDIRISAENSIATVKYKVNSDRDSDIKKINDTPWKKTETDSAGQPIEQAKADRDKKIKMITALAAQSIEKAEKEQKEAAIVSENKILKEIKSNYKILTKKQTVSSLDDSTLMRIGNYNGNEKNWIVTINIIFGNTLVYSTEIPLPYKTVTGKTAKYGTAEYNDTVEEYESYFRLNVPVLYSEAEYYITPLEEKNPSQYMVELKRITIYEIKTGKKVITKKFRDTEINYSFLPASDIRTPAQVEEDKKEAIEEELKKQKKLIRQAEKEKENKKTFKQKMAEGTSFITPVKHAGCELGVRKDLNNSEFADYNTWFATIDFPLKAFYYGIDGNFAKVSDDSNLFGIGAHLGIHTYGFGKIANTYLSTGGGVQFNKGSDLLPQYDTWYVQGTLGVHLLYCVSLSYSLAYYGSDDFCSSFCASLAINGPWSK